MSGARLRALLEGLPDTVRIGPFDWTLTVWDEPPEEYRDAFGICIPDRHAIGIARDLPSPAKLVETILHEILHGIYETYNIESADEEKIVTSAATALTQVFRDNPWLTGWMARALKT